MVQQQHLGGHTLERDADVLKTLLNSSPTPAGVVSHASLLGLTADDHTQYVHLSSPRTITGQHTFSPGSAQAPFILGANAQSQVVVGLRADELNKAVTAGNGLTGGGTLTAGVTITLGTPSSVSAASTNTVSGTTHSHAATSSSNPGAAASLLSTDASGLLTLAGLTLTGTLNSRSIIPTSTDAYTLGDATHLWLKGWLSELDAVLFSQNSISVVGGWMYVSKMEGTIPAGNDVTAGATQINFGTNANMAANDFVVLRQSLQVEYVQLLSIASGTTWNVTRNVDGSGANAWPSGSIWVNIGYNGTGRIELNANATPRISIMRQGTTYSAQTEVVRIGDLNGLGGTSSEAYGFFAGDNTNNNYFAYDPTNGFRIKASSGALLIDSNGIGITPTTSGVYARSYHFISATMDYYGVYGYETASTVELNLEVSSTAGKYKNLLSEIQVRQHDPAYSAQISVWANGGSGISGMYLYSAPTGGSAYANFGGSSYVGAVIGYITGAPIVPNAMLDVRGDTAMTGGIIASAPIAALVHNSGALTMTHNSSTTLTFDSEDLDNYGMHSASGSTLTAPYAGVYFVWGSAQWAASTGGTQRGFTIYKGTTPIASETRYPNAIGANVVVSCIVYLAASDTVHLEGYQDSGAGLNINATSALSPYFGMIRIA